MDFNAYRRLQDALAWVRTGAVKELAPGRHELFDGVYVNISAYRTKTEGRYEAHRKYLDIQILLKGREIIRLADLKKMTEETPYDAEKDILFGSAEGKDYLLREGEWMVIFPEEAHLPGQAAGEPEEVVKAVVKVPV